MGFIFGIVKRLIRLFIYFITFAAVIVLIPNLPPYTSFSKIDLEPTLSRAGPLAPNNHLDNVQKLYPGKLLGPECFQIHKEEVYTSLATGEIVKISPGGAITFVTKFGQSCDGLKEEEKCGRPLGFVIDKKSVLYAADAYQGIWSVDLESNKKKLLVSPRVEIGGQTPKIFNGVALDSKGNLYYTDSSADFGLQDGVFTLFADPNGRLFQYNAAKNESKVLLDKLWLPNGLAVSPNDEFLVFAETGAFRLMKYYLNGPKKGRSEVFLGGLPGAPDNLRSLGGAGLQVALYAAHDASEPVLLRSLAAVPLARKFLLRMHCIAEAIFRFLNSYYPHVFFEDAVYNIGHFKSFSSFLPKSSALIHVDWNGNIIQSYFHTEGQIHISDAVLYKDKIYMGQPHRQDYIATVPAPESFKKAFASIEEVPQVKKPVPTPIKVVPVEAAQKPSKATPPPPKPAQEVPKPTQPPKPAQQPPKPAQQPPKPIDPPKPAQQPPKPAQEPPKPAQQPPKPAQQPPKPAQQPPKPAQEPPKPTQPPKPAQQSSTPAPPKATPPPATPKPKPAEQKQTPPPAAKPVQEDKPKPQAKVDKPAPAKAADQKKQSPPKEKAPQEIPIIEEIPSDTRRPSKETLKVIKKEGPAEIPNPEL